MVQFSQCIDCKHFKGLNDNGKYSCSAFPDGIPDDVFWNKVLHEENIEGDNKIKFEPIQE